MNKNIRLLLLFSGVISVLLSSCKFQNLETSTKVGDGGLLSGEPCSPPCFWNIVPGHTTQDQCVKILQEKGVFQDCTVFDNTKESGSRGIVCDPILIVTFKENADIVSGIGFGVTQEIPIENVIEKYGNPNSVLVTTVSFPEENPRTAMMLYYDTLNMTIDLPEQESDNYDLRKNILIENVGYSDDHSYKLIKAYSTSWSGFGYYEPKYR